MGHLVPVGAKLSNFSPFHFRAKVEEATQLMIKLMHCAGKPKLVRVTLRKFQSILS